MLRPTAARAFGSPAGEGSAAPSAPAASRRDEAARQLFRDLHDRLGALGRDPAELSAFEISSQRARPGGLELHLRGPRAALSFVDTLEGTIEVEVGEGGARRLVELLAVQWEGAAFRPIRKPVRPGRRTGFAFTSAVELARRYAAWARHGVPPDLEDLPED